MGRKRSRRDAIEMSRRSMLGGTAAGLASLLTRGLPLGIGTVLLSPQRADAAVVCFDPVPDPTAAGWTQEGNQPPQGQGSPLIVRDPSTQADTFINFFCPGDDPLFTTEIVLTPRLSIDGGFVADGGNIGVHVTINDGAREVRAMIFDAGGGKSRVALIKADNQASPGFTFNNLSPDFTLKRRTNGTGVLSVPSSGMPDEEIPLTVQALSSRPGKKTLEFGSHKSYGGQSSSTSRWTTLGLPRVASPIGLTARQVRINDDNDDTARFLGTFTLGSGQTIDPTTEQVTLRFKFTALGTDYYSAGGPAGLPPGSFERKHNSSPARWGLTDTARDNFGIERFDILERDGSISFVDRRTSVFTNGDFTNTTIEFAVGDDKGSVDVVLEERPADSGRWRSQ